MAACRCTSCSAGNPQRGNGGLPPSHPGRSVPASASGTCACSVPRVKRNRESSLLRDRRVQGLIGLSLLVGFLIGMVFFGKPWHLPPNWGDVRTWLLVVLAGVAAWVGFVQLRILRNQIAEEVESNKKRDELMDKQLAEAEARAESERRGLVEDVDVLFTGKTGYVVNNSRRPLNDVTCKVMSKVDRHSLATADGCGEVDRGPGGQGWMFLPGAKPVSRFVTLRPKSRCGFTFKDLTREPDQVLVAWFTDDAGFRWQLDQHLHLVQSDDESEYVPVIPARVRLFVGCPRCVACRARSCGWVRGVRHVRLVARPEVDPCGAHGAAGFRCSQADELPARIGVQGLVTAR